jgi:hypothetical protein
MEALRTHGPQCASRLSMQAALTHHEMNKETS